MPPTSPMTISLVTCSFEHGEYIAATLRSVLEQEYPALEYIVMDGGSRDETVDILRRYGKYIDYWVSEPDGGQTDALIKGFARSRGEIMGWLCSDDLLLPNALATVSQFFTDHPTIDAVYGDALWIDREGNLIRPKREIAFSRFLHRFDHNYVPQPSMFWRRRVFDQVGGLNPRFNLSMDSDLWDRISGVTPIAHIPVFLSCMRYYAEQKTRALRPAGLVEDSEIRGRSRWAKWPVLAAMLSAIARTRRRLTKLVTGGYTSAVPARLISALERYRITGDRT